MVRNQSAPVAPGFSYGGWTPCGVSGLVDHQTDPSIASTTFKAFVESRRNHEERYREIRHFDCLSDIHFYAQLVLVERHFRSTRHV